MCIYSNCQTRPCYNIESNKKPLYCFAHKTDEMIDVRHRICMFEGCKKRPQYNNVSETIGLYCLPHKHDGMVNVVDKKCVFEGCTKRPQFNEMMKKKDYIVTHIKLKVWSM